MKDNILMSVLKPFLPQIKNQLTPSIEMLVEGRLAEINANNPIPNTQPAIVILQDDKDNIYVCDCLIEGGIIQGVRRKQPLAALTNQIVSVLTDA